MKFKSQVSNASGEEGTVEASGSKGILESVENQEDGDLAAVKEVQSGGQNPCPSEVL